MNTYHCTRNEPYQNHRCLGRNSPEVRQGYYIDAASELEAIAPVAAFFPAAIPAAVYTQILTAIRCGILLATV